MKPILTAFFVLTAITTFAQTVAPKQPIEEQYHISPWWWLIGVIIALGIGIGVYMLIKKDPKRDAVR